MSKQEDRSDAAQAVNAWLSEQREKNRQKRQTKLDASDVERAIVERRTRATRGAASRAPMAISIGVGVALLLCAGFLSAQSVSGTRTFEHERELVADRIAIAEGDLAEIPTARKDEATQYAAEITAQLEEAIRKGQEVAALQQEFTAILGADDMQGGQNGAPSPAFTAAAEHRRQLAPYFLERSLIVDESLAYAPSSVAPYDAGEIDPRYPWYLAYDEVGKVVSPGRATWSLESMVPGDTDGVFRATWLNRDPDTGDLYAWATASYYVESGGFADLVVGTTTIGSRSKTPLQEAGQ